MKTIRRLLTEGRKRLIRNLCPQPPRDWRKVKTVAWREAIGIEPITGPFDLKGEPLDYVKTLCRRHLMNAG